MTVGPLEIFPVFAGMIPKPAASPSASTHFPRIRGDDPETPLDHPHDNQFSRG